MPACLPSSFTLIKDEICVNGSLKFFYKLIWNWSTNGEKKDCDLSVAAAVRSPLRPDTFITLATGGESSLPVCHVSGDLRTASCCPSPEKAFALIAPVCLCHWKFFFRLPRRRIDPPEVSLLLHIPASPSCLTSFFSDLLGVIIVLLIELFFFHVKELIEFNWGTLPFLCCYCPW